MMLDSRFALKSNVIRKSVAACYRLPRAWARMRAKASDYPASPPILVNSIPKSGTHLLLQVARAVPGTRYYGSFVAQHPSLTLRKRSAEQVIARLRRLAPGEVVGAHLYHDPAVARFLTARPAIQLFVYRDPRDVVLSEAHYLAVMNRWHRLHRMIKRLPDEERRVRTLIEGIPGLYADIGSRLRRYLGWLDEPGVIAVRYEDLEGAQRAPCLRALAERIVERSPCCGPADLLAQSMEAAITPERSHTFREGGSGKWRTEMSTANLERIGAHARDVMDALGYA